MKWLFPLVYFLRPAFDALALRWTRCRAHTIVSALGHSMQRQVFVGDVQKYAVRDVVVDGLLAHAHGKLFSLQFNVHQDSSRAAPLVSDLALNVVRQRIVIPQLDRSALGGLSVFILLLRDVGGVALVRGVVAVQVVVHHARTLQLPVHGGVVDAQRIRDLLNPGSAVVHLLNLQSVGIGQVVEPLELSLHAVFLLCAFLRLF